MGADVGHGSWGGGKLHACIHWCWCQLLLLACATLWRHTGHGLQARDAGSHLRDVLLEEIGGGVLALLALQPVGNGCVVGVISGMEIMEQLALYLYVCSSD